MSFDFAYEFTKKWEKGLCDVPEDPGGITKDGVSIALLKDLARRKKSQLESLGIPSTITPDVVRSLTPDQCREVFKMFFWDENKIERFPKRVAAFLFDCAVNHGWKNAVKLAQRGYNGTIGVYGSKLAVDGVMGYLSETALRNESDKLIEKCIDARVKFYNDIVASKPRQSVFLKGWLNRASDQRRYLGV